MNIADLTKDTLIPILLDSARRQQFVAALRQEPDNDCPLFFQYEQVAPVCHATPDGLRAVVALLRTRPYRALHLLDALLFHPQLPEDVLLDLARDPRWVTPLAHRQGPRALLEYLAQTYQTSEAITTLALSYYPHDSADIFAHFLAQHRDNAMLRYNVPNSPALSKKQRSLAAALLGLQ